MIRFPERLLAAALLLPALFSTGCAEQTDARSDFAKAIDLAAFETLAVQHEGRIKSFESVSRTVMGWVSGPRRYQDQSPSFTFLDMAFRPAAYDEADVIYVKNKPMRPQIVQALRAGPVGSGTGFEARAARFVETGLISPAWLQDAGVQQLLVTLSNDLVRTAKFVNMVQDALMVRRPEVLHGFLRMVAPPVADEQQPWLSLVAVANAGAVQQALAPLRPGDPEGPDPDSVHADTWRDEVGAVRSQYVDLQRAWAAEDAVAVNAALAALQTSLPAIEPELYPSHDRLSWESWYFKSKSMTWVWVLYVPSVVLLLMALAWGWGAARKLGMASFIVAFGFHTFALGLRWYVSGRWPNTNMFEAVTTAAWFGGALALPIEWWARRTGMRNLFALGSAVSSMVALMAAYYLPVALTPAIENKMPVLHDVWLYIHTNVIIASYCLMFMAAVSGLLYLGHRLIGGKPDHVVLGGAGSLMLGGPGLGSGGGGGGVAGGDAGALPAPRPSLGRVLDGVTMVLMEVAFVSLFAGVVMGAIWADHSWGRPWGWDPKEVFALGTFLVLAVLVHVRFKAKDKGLWTAVLAVIGAGVMLFNWIVINFVITGLHSYA